MALRAQTTRHDLCSRIAEGSVERDVLLSAMYMPSLLIRAQAMLSALGMLEHGGRVCGPNLVQLWSASPYGGEGADLALVSMPCCVGLSVHAAQNFRPWRRSRRAGEPSRPRQTS